MKRLGLWMGPLLFVLTVCFVHPEGLSSDGIWVLGAVLWIATWWVTEAIPIPAASLLPVVLFPIAGESIAIKDIASVYMQPVMFLFVGGFMVALAMQKWGLHKRIALSIVAWLGSNLKGVVGGFILAAGLLSMGISNTATTLMMVP
ncbi:MAG: SLC13 family permease, partial [Bacteroidota bacterium]